MSPSRRTLFIAASTCLFLGLLAFGFWLGSSRSSNRPESNPAASSASPNPSPSVPAQGTGGPSIGSAHSITAAQQIEWNKNARPTERTSLLLLDLSKVPTEKDLREAGQLGEELIPTASADAVTEAQKKDNTSFGRAIQDWNLHNYDAAYTRFLEHIVAFPKSPWAGEAELHLGCYCQYKKQYTESQKWFEAAKSRSPTGHGMNAKATLRLGVLAMDRGQLTKATEDFASLRAASDTPSHSSYASYWIVQLSLMKKKQTAMRDCAQKSLAEICAVLGKHAEAEKLRKLENTNPDGLNLEEIEMLAKQHGLAPQSVLTSAERMADMPLPFIAHYGKDEHFVVVLGQPSRGKIKLYDTRVGQAQETDYVIFQKQWSGHAVVFAPLPETHAGILIASAETKREVFGGCCGLPREPSLTCGRPSENSGGGCGTCSYGMPSWQVDPVNMNLSITDTPIWWEAPYGPSINMTLTYNSLDSLTSIRPFGDKWTFHYAAYAMQDPSGNVVIVYGNSYIERYTRVTAYSASPAVTGTFNPIARHPDTTLTQTGTYTFVMKAPDGTTYHFGVPTNMQGASAASLLTSIIDKYGNIVDINHNSQGAITTLTHSATLTETWALNYGANGKVANITDPFGRTATFTYPANGPPQLTGQTDMAGVAYSYGYTLAERVRERDPLYPNFGHSQKFVVRSSELLINSLNLPTGTWQFYTEPADGIPNPRPGTSTFESYPANGGLMYENYRITVTDPTAHACEYYFDGYHNKGWYRDWNHYQQGVPGEVATRYSYEDHDQNVPGSLGKINATETPGGGTHYITGFNDAGLPAQTTAPDGRITKFTYNSKGKVLTLQEGEDTDPNRILYTTTYATSGTGTGIDVLTESKKVGSGATIQLSSITYNTQRDPLTRISYVQHNGQTIAHTTTYTYNTAGQVTEVMDERGGVTKNTWLNNRFLTNGRLDKVEYKAPGRTTFLTIASYVYDDIGRLIGETNQDGYVLLHEYDNLNRPTKTTYPDTTYTQSTYSCCTLTSTRARDGGITSYSYDALKRTTQVVKPGGDIVSYEYDANGNTTRLRFGRGEWVAWEYDNGNRKTAKLYPNGSRLSYGYDTDNGGRLAWSKDASNRQTTYNYNTDGRVTSVTHPTLPAQSYTYDAEGRVLTWTDGSGSSARVTTNAYDAEGRLTSVDGPLADDTLSYTYDEWGRPVSWNYAGGTESYTFDDLERTATITNPLGTFTNTYEGDTGVLNEVQYPLAGMKTTYQRMTVNQDRLLTAIIHSAPTSQGGGELARYDYTYNAQHQIATWRQAQPNMSAKEWAIAYDERQQVSAIVETPVGTPPVNPQQVWRYQYDKSGNRTAVQEGNQTRTSTYNELNQMTGLSNGGNTWFRGKVNEPANVTIAGQNARVYADGTFESLTNVGAGQQDVAVSATDKAGNSTNETWRVDNGPAGTLTPTYDTEGNLLTDGTYTCTWDARNRLDSVTKGSDTWTFSYDGQDRRISESKNSALVRQWVWVGTSIIEERLIDDTKQRRWGMGIELLNSSGQQTSKRLLVGDHLGSLRVEVDGTSGAPIADYAFNPWGQRTLIGGTGDVSLGYTGHLWHESGLSLAVYRGYDPSQGRWLNRDPIEEEGGVNLYAYCLNTPTTKTDYLGEGGWGEIAAADMEDYYCRENCGKHVTRALETEGHSWFVNLATRIVAWHEFVVLSDGTEIANGGDATGGDHWTATTRTIRVKKGKCQEFNICMKEKKKSSGPYDWWSNNCRFASKWVAECGGILR